MVNKLFLKVFTFFLFLAICEKSRGQKVEAQIPEKGPNRVYLVNKLRKDTLIIYLSYDQKQWFLQKLIPKAVTPYRVNENIYIKVPTGSTAFVQYALNKNQTYSVEWNNTSSKWDVFYVPKNP